MWWRHAPCGAPLRVVRGCAVSGILPPRRDEAAALATLVLSTLLDPDPRTPDFDDSVLSAARRALPWIRRAGMTRRSAPLEPSWWPRGEHGQPLLPDGSVDVRKLCAELDERYNKGLPEPKR